MKRKFINLFFMAMFLCISSSYAVLEPACLFTDSMVIQRDIKVPVWGWADVGKTITVTFHGQNVTATARDSSIAAYKGYWKAWLNPISAQTTPSNLVISDGSSSITIKGVLVGDVWICGGQSNMEASFNDGLFEPSAPEMKILPPANQPISNIRLNRITSCNSLQEVLDIRKTDQWPRLTQPYIEARVSDHWRHCSRENASAFSIPAIHVGIQLYRDLNIPIGLVLVARGGTGLPTWPSKATSEMIYNKLCNGNTSYVTPTYQPIRYFQSAGDEKTYGGFFAGMVKPIVGYAIKGVVWWQGEQEALGWGGGRVCFYSTGGFKEMIKDWRRLWGQGDFPFVYNQLQGECGQAPSFEIRDYQMQALELPNTGMSISYDSAAGIHPTGKEIIAPRLHRAIKAVAYGQNIIPTGPIYNGMSIEGNSIRIKFSYVGTGLTTFSGTGTTVGNANDTAGPFYIAGADNVYHPANATIDQANNTVLVTSPAVLNPKNVRFGITRGHSELSNWKINPTLFNKERLPASPFRTDTWKGLNVSINKNTNYTQPKANQKFNVLKILPFSTMSSASQSEPYFDIQGRNIKSINSRSRTYSTQLIISK